MWECACTCARIFVCDIETNMLVVALKGFLLIGVISWYSVAIMSMINDYFRAEFKDYLKKNPITSPKMDHVPADMVITSPSPSPPPSPTTTTPVEQHIGNEKLFEAIDNANNGRQQQIETNEVLEWSNVERMEVDNGRMHCILVNNRRETLMRLVGRGHHSYVNHVCVRDPLIVV